MTIIDLLNKIANDEEVPKKIKYCGTIYEKFDYNNKYYDIDNENREKDLLSEHLASKAFYNDTVEILEKNKIEKLKLDEEHCRLYKNNDEWWAIKKHQLFVYKKFNNLIDEINKLKEK